MKTAGSKDQEESGLRPFRRTRSPNNADGQGRPGSMLIVRRSARQQTRIPNLKIVDIIQAALNILDDDSDSTTYEGAPSNQASDETSASESSSSP